MPSDTTSNQVAESVLAQWQEPATHALSLQRLPLWLIIGSAGVLMAALIGIGYRQHDLTYYLAAAVSATAALALVAQSRQPSRQLDITLTNYRLQIGKRDYPLVNLAGFWLEEEPGFVVVNVEAKKRTALPITFFFPAAAAETAKATLLQVLPEIEPRPDGLSDQLSRLIRL